MKKLVKSVLVLVAVVAAFGLFLNVTGSNVILDFENSGNFEWVPGDDDYETDFDNSGNFEWVPGDDDYELKANNGNGIFTLNVPVNRHGGFKNSGLPETIEVESLS